MQKWCYMCGEMEDEEIELQSKEACQFAGIPVIEPPTPETTPPSGFTVKDSGRRETLAGGMVRDTTEGKVNYSLVLDGPMFQRWAEHLTKGAQKYSKRNWMKAANGTPEERRATMERFRESAVRHFVQWISGHTDEDHAAATMFNINGYEFLRATLEPEPPGISSPAALALVRDAA